MEPSKIWIVVVLALALLCAIRGSFLGLLILDIAASAAFPDDWYVASVLFNGSDIVFAMLILLAVVGRWPEGGTRLRDVPGIRVWILIGLLSSWAYVAAPMNAIHLTDPARVAYQLYRYCWKPILFYPLVYIVVGSDPRRARTLLTAMLVMGGYTAATRLNEYFGGAPTTSFIRNKNLFAGLLIAPTIACFAMVLATPAGRRRALLLAGLALLGSGLVVAGSRGALVAAAAAAGLLTLRLVRFAGGRRRLLRLAGWGALGLIVVVVLLAPDISRLPGVKLLMELDQGTQVHNLTWRATERWPYFSQKVLQNPGLGVGTDRDQSLGLNAVTPHNGYLSLALIHGLPMAVLTVMFGIHAIRVARRTFLQRGDSQVRLLALGVGAAIVGLLVHNIVESTLNLPYVSKLYWLLVALGIGSFTLQFEASPHPVQIRIARHRRRRARGRVPVRALQPAPETPGD
jgi:hypothetical protein